MWCFVNHPNRNRDLSSARLEAKRGAIRWRFHQLVLKVLSVSSVLSASCSAAGNRVNLSLIIRPPFCKDFFSVLQMNSGESKRNQIDRSIKIKYSNSVQLQPLCIATPFLQFYRCTNLYFSFISSDVTQPSRASVCSSCLHNALLVHITLPSRCCRPYPL